MMADHPSSLKLQAPHLKIIQEILQKIIPNAEVAAFGSRTRAEAPLHQGSDIDLVIFGKKPSLETLSKLLDAFDEAPLPMKTDISLWQEMTPQFQNLIKPDLIFIQKKSLSITPQPQKQKR